MCYFLGDMRIVFEKASSRIRYLRLTGAVPRVYHCRVVLFWACLTKNDFQHDSSVQTTSDVAIFLSSTCEPGAKNLSSNLRNAARRLITSPNTVDH
ncbi:hypothetical protein R1flu_002418 [Riccia fluitans]|uniref:Uncharacterized protein n=1 Tax=Riccia fluitans TaxID=41844 RepID=A0ABD1Y619_9MARC